MVQNVTDPQFILNVSLLVIPAYLSNGMANVFGDGRPIDGGRIFVDGKRVLGDGKTVRGFVAGISFGTFGSLLEAVFVSLFVINTFPWVSYVALGFLIAVGAMTGDVTGAFIKRRVGLPRGSPAPPLDQLNFILISLLFAFIFNTFVPLIEMTATLVIIIIVITPFAHLTSCYIGYKLGKKKEPW